MKREKYLALLIIISGLTIAGCNENSMMNQGMQDALSASPAGGALDVRLDEKIVLIFAKPVNREVVERDFHLVSEKDMADSACMFGEDMMHGDMNLAMMDSAKMNHLMSQHSTPGTFSWSSDTRCIFTPDSLLMPGMNYMMHFDNEMIEMMNGVMGDMMGGNMMGGMQGMGSGNMMNHMMLHFTTMYTTGTGGHDDHH